MAPLLTKVRTRLYIHARRRSLGLLEGQYGSVFKGRSLEFEDLRRYERGDDVSDIDWKATARSPHPLVRRFIALRKHRVILVVDTGREMAAHATVDATRRDVAVLVAGALGHIAQMHGDLVGLVAGNTHGVVARPPKGSATHLEGCLRLIHDGIRADGPPGDTSALLSRTARLIRQRSILVLVVDELGLQPDDETRLRTLAVQHDVLVVRIGALAASDPALAGRRVVDVGSAAPVPTALLGDRALHEEVARSDAARRADIDRMLARLGISQTVVSDEAEVVGALLRLLDQRRRRTA